MARTWPVIIVGDGPAAVAAAFPLVERGVDVLLLGAGREPLAPPAAVGTLAAIRQSQAAWRPLLGERLEALGNLAAPSSKFRIPRHAPLLAAFNKSGRVHGRNFQPVGVFAQGGLASVWGAGVSAFDDADLAEYPIRAEDLRPGYGLISKRIGVSGSNVDAMADAHGRDAHLLPAPECAPSAATLLRRFQRNPAPAAARRVRLGRGRNAVATVDIGERQGCAHCGLCLWGCPRRAIWSPAYDLARLRRRPNFQHLTGCFATRLARCEGGWSVAAGTAETKHAPTRRFRGERVVLAAGAIGTARLVLDALGMHGGEVPLATSPAAGFAVVVPRAVAAPLADERLFALAQLSFRVEDAALERGYAQGNLFAADGIPAAEFVRQAGVSYGFARTLVRLAQPQVLVGNCYFDSAYTRHTLRVSSSGEVTATGRFTPSLGTAAALVRKRLGAAWRRYGALLAPGGFRLLAPGEDAHYGATVPMRESPRRHEAGANGEVRGLPGVFVVDGAALTALPPKAHTFTIMANATRIATSLADAAVAGAANSAQ